jgi:hypothetical protein
VKASNGHGLENIKLMMPSARGETEANSVHDGSAEFPPVSGKSEVSLRFRVYQVDMGPPVPHRF